MTHEKHQDVKPSGDHLRRRIPHQEGFVMRNTTVAFISVWLAMGFQLERYATQPVGLTEVHRRD